MNKQTIKLLIISHQAESRLLIQELLSKSPEFQFNWLEADSGSSGLEIVFREAPDCILLDAALPDMETDNLLKNLNPDLLNPRFPVILLSGEANESSVKTGIRNGAQDYLIREHLTTREIVRAILNSLEKVELRRELGQSLIMTNQFKTLIEHARDVIFFIRPSDGRIIDTNETALERYGYQRDELLSLTIYDLRANKNSSRINQQLAQAATEGIFFETVHRRKDGTTFPVEVSSSGALIGGEKILLSIVRDTTQRKQTEHQLQRNHETFYNLVQNTPFGIYVVDSDFRLVQISKGSQKVFSNIEPLIGRDFTEILRIVWEEPFASEAIEHFRNTLATGQPYRAVNSSEQRGNIDEIESYDWKIERVVLPDGQFGVVCYFYDLTDLQNTQQALRESEERFRLASVAAGALVYDSDLAGTRPVIVHGLERVTGYTNDESELTSQWWHSLIHPADLPTHLENLENSLKTDATYHSTYRVHHKDGKWIWVEDIAQIIRDKNDQPVQLIGAIIDIDERKKAEAAQAQLAAIVEWSSDAVISKDLNGTIITWNRGAEDLFGYTADEVIGKSITILIPTEYSDEETRILNNLKQGKPILHYETIRQRKDGTRINISLSVSPIRDQANRIIGASKIARDITEQKLSEQALRESEEKFRTLADNMSQFAWMADEKGQVFWYNERWFEYSGTTLEEMKGGAWQKVHHPEHAERVFKKLQEHWASGEIWEDTFPLRSKTGEYRWFLSRAVPIRDQDGKIVRWFGTNTDITEREEMLEREQILRRQAEDANRSKDEFLAVLSHELRTPLNSIKGWVSMLQNQPMDEQKRIHAIEVIARNVHSQNALIEDILDVSRIISGKMRLEVERMLFVSVLQNVINEIGPNAERKGVNLTTSLDVRADEMDGDAVRLRQIISNLLNNAIKFTPEGGHINIQLVREKNTAKLTITDNGIGISSDLLPRIFDRFQQADATSRRQFGGLGLGLAIVKHLVELHGGTISAKSEGEGKGAVFIVNLPLVPETIPFPNLKTSERSWIDSPNLLEGKRILVVDDDQDSLELVIFALRQAGGEVCSANSASKALQQLKEKSFDLLISDLGMAGMDGYDLIKQVREAENGIGKKLPAIALTGYVSTDERERVMQAGFQRHLPKPLDVENLAAISLEVIKSLTENSGD